MQRYPLLIAYMINPGEIPPAAATVRNKFRIFTGLVNQRFIALDEPLV